jgi:SPP1 gp7 family putative phage head morphogenesis protein
MLALNVDRSALSKDFFGRLPRSEVFARRYYGRNLDLNAIENAIRMAEIGIMSPISDLERESNRNDTTLSGMLYKRFAEVAACDHDLTPAQGVDPARAKQVCERTRRMLLNLTGFGQSIYDLAWADFDGRGAEEVMWEAQSGLRQTPFSDFTAPDRFTPREIRWIHPGRLSFGPQRELRVVERHRQTSMYYAVGPALQELPAKFVFGMPRQFGDYPEREGLGPRTLYWSFFKRFSWRQRMILTELFALPWRIIETDKDATVAPEELDDAEEAADTMGTQGTSSIALAPGQKLRLEAPHPDSGEFFGMTSADVNNELAVLILGQNVTTQGDSNRAEAVQMKQEQNLILKRAGVFLEGLIQKQLIHHYLALNIGDDEARLFAPKFTLRTSPPKDRKAEMDRVVQVVSLGVPVAEDEVYEISGFRKPINGERVVIGVAPAPSDGGLPGSGPKGPVGKVSEGSGSPQEAVENLLDIFDADLLGEDAENDTVAATRPRLLGARQPDTVNGSPESIVAKGVREGQRETAKWAQELATACEGKDRETAIYNTLKRTAERLPLEKLTRSIERKIVHSAMLGALDAHWEMSNDSAIAAPKFDDAVAAGSPRGAGDASLTARAPGDALLLVIGASGGVVDFAASPFAEAVKHFASQKVVTKRAFERLAADAKRRAFTVAGLARKEMLNTAHDELTKALEAGDDLRTFSKALGARFESAGWTALNPSHVETVFRNATMKAYDAGRTEQMTQPAVLAARPFWQCMGVKDDRTRPTHAAAHGKVLAATDAFWSRSPLPWGHNCRCRKVSRSQADLDRLGLVLTTGAEIQGLPDDGWNAEGA